MKKIFIPIIFLFLAINLLGQTGNVIPNPDFSNGSNGDLPSGWSLVANRPSLAPSFSKGKKDGQSYLLMKGTGNPVAVGYLKTNAPVALGQTYEFKVLFSKSDELNPQRHLLFQCKGPGNHDGIMEFYKRDHGLIEGRAKIFFPGEGKDETEIRLYYRLLSNGEAKIYNVSLTPTDPIPPHWIRVACTSGFIRPEQVATLVERAASEKTDLLLLPEYLNQSVGAETLTGETCRMLASQAAKHKMFIAAGIIRHDEDSGNKYNTAVLFDRAGKLIGTYDKIHPYSPELNDEGFTPGNSVRVFDTELGKISFVVCYDSWFTDVTELAALKGAEIILLPNAGYYKSLMHARAADNRVRIVVSSLYGPPGIFDTAGRDIQNPFQDPTVGIDNKTFDNMKEYKIDGIQLLVASLDINCSPSPHYNGGSMMEAPGGRRNRTEQLYYPDDDLEQEKERWWVIE